MNRRIILVFVVLAFVVSGCGKYYHQEGKSLVECKENFGECAAELEKYRDVNAEDDLARFNIAYDYEGQFMDTCMKEKGYEIVSEYKLPLKVKREEPNPWDVYDRGFAGTIGEL